MNNQAKIKLLYDSQDISEDISKSVISINYTDHIKGKSDEIEIILEDTNGLYSNDWYPNKGSKLTLSINDVECGVFSIDEININVNPDTVTWRGISTHITSKLRTKNSKAFEGKSLLKIAQEIANNHDLTVDDGSKTITIERPNIDDEQAKLKVLASFSLKISAEKNKTLFYQEISAMLIQLSPIITSLKRKGYEKESEQLQIAVSVLHANMTSENTSRLSMFISKIRTELYREPTTITKKLGTDIHKIIIERSTQNNETDLAYLSRISSDYGLAFNIKPPYMVFYSIKHLEAAPGVLTLDKATLTSFSFTDKTEGTYSNAKISYHNPYTGEVVKNSVKQKGSTTEQGNLSVIHKLMRLAGIVIDYELRSRQISQANDLIVKTIKGLQTNGFNDEAQRMIESYAVLLNDKTVAGCIRFANFCTELIKSLKESQLNAIISDKSNFVGGQKSDTLIIKKKVENAEQADKLANAKLNEHNSKTRTGSASSIGNILLLAGNNFNLTGFGRIDGKYSIISSTHSISKDGYSTSFEFKQGAV